jgi:hypothetical protein
MLAAAAMYSPRARADVTFNLNGCSSVSVSGTQVTCVINTTPPPSGGGPACSITVNQSPSSSAGGAVSLSANCSSLSPVWFAWVKNGAAYGDPQAPSITDSLPANNATTAVSYTYGLTACTNSACAPTAWVQISVPGNTGSGSGSGTWPVSCPGFTKTLAIDMPWQSTDASSRILTTNYGGFGSNDALVVRITPPAGSGSYASGWISMAEWGGGPITRYSQISTTPCDFGLASNPGSWNTLYNVSTGVSLSYSLQVGGSQQPWIMLLLPGVPYYLNVKNTTYTGAQTCPSGSQCNMFLDFYKPPGT